MMQAEMKALGMRDENDAIPRVFIRYHWNGQRIGGDEALQSLADVALYAGHELDDLMPLWEQRGTSEECRDMLNELSGYNLEIIVINLE